jgi:hypothetical protein
MALTIRAFSPNISQSVIPTDKERRMGKQEDRRPSKKTNVSQLGWPPELRQELLLRHLTTFGAVKKQYDDPKTRDGVVRLITLFGGTSAADIIRNIGIRISMSKPPPAPTAPSP